MSKAGGFITTILVTIAILIVVFVACFDLSTYLCPHENETSCVPCVDIDIYSGAQQTSFHLLPSAIASSPSAPVEKSSTKAESDSESIKIAAITEQDRTQRSTRTDTSRDASLKESTKRARLMIGKVLGTWFKRPDTQRNDLTESNAGRTQVVKVKLQDSTGQEILSIDNELSDNPICSLNVKPGDELVLKSSTHADNNIKGSDLSIIDHHRLPGLAILLGVFLSVFLFSGGKESLKSLAVISASFASLALFLLPLCLKGGDPVLLCLTFAFLVSCAYSVTLHGPGKIALAASAGTASGLLVTAAASILGSEYIPLSGLATEGSQLMRSIVLVHSPEFYRSLMTAEATIASTGFLVFSTTSIAEAANALTESDRSLTSAELYSQALARGRQITGKMTSALLLLFAGGALPLFLLATQMEFFNLTNMDLFASLTTACLSGCIGLSLSVPMTALICARIMPPVKR